MAGSGRPTVFFVWVGAITRATVFGRRAGAAFAVEFGCTGTALISALAPGTGAADANVFDEVARLGRALFVGGGADTAFAVVFRVAMGAVFPLAFARRVRMVFAAGFGGGGFSFARTGLEDEIGRAHV